jgi:hypothetical protein
MFLSPQKCNHERRIIRWSVAKVLRVSLLLSYDPDAYGRSKFNPSFTVSRQHKPPPPPQTFWMFTIFTALPDMAVVSWLTRTSYGAILSSSGNQT